MGITREEKSKNLSNIKILCKRRVFQLFSSSRSHQIRQILSGKWIQKISLEDFLVYLPIILDSKSHQKKQITLKMNLKKKILKDFMDHFVFLPTLWKWKAFSANNLTKL